MYWVEEIEWIGDGEAELALYDGKYRIKCFSHPCQSQIGDRLDEVLFCIFADRVVKIDEKYEIVQTEAECILCGELIDRKEKHLKIGAFIFQLETIPGDIGNGDFVEVVCDRISI